MIAVLHLMLSCVDLSSTRMFLGAGDVACSSAAEGLPSRHSQHKAEVAVLACGHLSAGNMRAGVGVGGDHSSL